MSEGDRIRVPIVGRAQIKGDSSRTPSLGRKVARGQLCVSALGNAPRSKAAAVSQHPRPRPSQSWTNRSRGSGVRRRSGARKPGPGGLVLRLLSRLSRSPAAGERPAGGQTWMEVSAGLRLVLQRRDGPLLPERTTAWLLTDASRLLRPFSPRFGSRAPGPMQTSCRPWGHSWGT